MKVSIPPAARFESQGLSGRWTAQHLHFMPPEVHSWCEEYSLPRTVLRITIFTSCASFHHSAPTLVWESKGRALTFLPIERRFGKDLTALQTATGDARTAAESTLLTGTAGAPGAGDAALGGVRPPLAPSPSFPRYHSPRRSPPGPASNKAHEGKLHGSQRNHRLHLAVCTPLC